jgi:hypothetical protein
MDKIENCQNEAGFYGVYFCNITIYDKKTEGQLGH